MIKINNFQMQVKSKEIANLKCKFAINQPFTILTSGKLKKNRIHYS